MQRKISTIATLSLSTLGLIIGWTQFSQAQLPQGNDLLALRQSISQNGPEEFNAFFQKHQVQRDRLPQDPALRATLDQLCQQRDCHASQLYWYTDLEQAKAAAQKAGKPILSLRMLGNLNEEMSCANSRFFRIALYSNSEISQTLRDRYILHWSSERPVPKMTIDFGDGRKLERTVTGNSIHYVLDPNGNPIEGIPGLYSPQAFLNQIKQIDQAFQEYQTLSDNSIRKSIFWAGYHRVQLESLQRKWSAELQELGIKKAPIINLSRFDAMTANRVAMSKSVIELPLIQQWQSDQKSLEKSTDDTSWQKLADRLTVSLDNNSLALMRAKFNPGNTDRQFDATVAQFQKNMALDTVRNEYILHAKIHQRFIDLPSPDNRTLERLNQWVYQDLFLTPKSDPWLGLKSDSDRFTAIEPPAQP